MKINRKILADLILEKLTAHKEELNLECITR